MEHGSASTYTNHGCHCEQCRCAHRAQAARRRAWRRDQRRADDAGRLVAPLPPEQHGNTSTYTNWSCRCRLCAEANRLYCKGLRMRQHVEAQR